MTTALGWDPTAPAVALRRVQARLLNPGSLAWFERLVPEGSDPWASFEALILAAMSGTSAPAPAAVFGRARPYAPRHDWPSPLPTRENAGLQQAQSPAASVATGIRQERPAARASQPADTPFAALRAIRAGAFAEPVLATRTAATSSHTASRHGPVNVPAPAATGSSPRAHAFTTGSAATPAPTSAQHRLQPAAVRPTQSSALTDLPHPAEATTAEQPQRPSSARVIGWPFARQQPRGGELPVEAKRTRVVEGLPALRNLMQSAVAQGRQPDTLPESDAPPVITPLAAPSTAPLARHTEPASPPASRPLGTPDPLAEDALVDRVIDRLDERLRELSIRHLGFTGGLGT